LPSDFGIYQAQDKFILESEKHEKVNAKRYNLLSSQGRNKGASNHRSATAVGNPKKDNKKN